MSGPSFEQSLPYVSFVLDDSLAVREFAEIPKGKVITLVGWQCGFEPLFVAVFSYLPGCKVDAAEAEDIAADYLRERKWFASDNPEEQECDYIIQGVIS